MNFSDVSNIFSNEKLTESLWPQIIICLLFIVVVLLNIRKAKIDFAKWYKTATACIIIIIGLCGAFFLSKSAIDKYQSRQLVDRIAIAEGLADLPKANIPDFSNLSIAERYSWRKAQIEAGHLTRSNCCYLEDKLYFSQCFKKKFGEPLYKKLGYDEAYLYYREKAIEEIRPQYEIYISDLYNKLLAPYDTIDNNLVFNPQKGLGAEWETNKNISPYKKLELLRSFSADNSKKEEIYPEFYLLIRLREILCFSTLILMFGVWLLLNNNLKIGIPKAILSVLLVGLCTAAVCVASNPLSNLVLTICVAVECVALWIFIGLRFAKKENKPAIETSRQQLNEKSEK